MSKNKMKKLVARETKKLKTKNKNVPYKSDDYTLIIDGQEIPSYASDNVIYSGGMDD